MARINFLENSAQPPSDKHNKLKLILGALLLITIIACIQKIRARISSPGTSVTSDLAGQKNQRIPNDLDSPLVKQLKEKFANDPKLPDILKALENQELFLKEVRPMYTTCYTWNTNSDGHGNFGSYATSSGKSAKTGKNSIEAPRTFASYWPEVPKDTFLYVKDFGYGVIHDRCGASAKDFTSGKMTRIDAFIGKYSTRKEAEAEEIRRTGVKWVAVFEPLEK